MSVKTKYIPYIENQPYSNIKIALDEWVTEKLKENNNSNNNITHSRETLQSIFAEINAAIHIKACNSTLKEDITNISLRYQLKRNYNTGNKYKIGKLVTDIDILGIKEKEPQFVCECISTQGNEYITEEALKIGGTKERKSKWYYLRNGNTNNSVTNTEQLKKIKNIYIAVPANYTITPEEKPKNEDCEIREKIRNCSTFLKLESKNLKRNITILQMPYEWNGKKEFPEGERQITTNTIDEIYELFIKNSPDSVELETVLNIIYTKKDQEKLFKNQSDQT